MKKNIIYWLPRILSLCFVALLALFAFDTFGASSTQEIIVGFFIHLIPAIIVLIVALVSWKYDLFGAIVFLGLAILYIIMVGFDRHWSWYVGVSGPAALVGALYLVGWMQSRRTKA